MNFPPDKSTRNTTRKNPWLLAGLACVVVALTVFFWSGGIDNNNAAQDGNPSASSSQKHRPNSLTDSTNSNPSAGGDASSNKTTSANPSAARPTDTRASHRDTVVNAKGERKQLIDPIASWENTPPWPEGPKLYASVETSTRHYVNLRPDDAGDLPRVYAEAEERIEVSVSFPDGEPGEKIYVELPNGGSFPDSDQFGRVFELSADRTLSIPYITDESRGHCNVMVRHRGHSRSLPIWVGAPLEPGS